MILINGVEDDFISISDRGLVYGDGVFRTMLMQQGQPLWWDSHFSKLQKDCAGLKLACPAKETLHQELLKVGANELECVVKITITRGRGARGYVVDPVVQPTRIVSTSSLPSYPDSYRQVGVKVRLCDLRLSLQPRLAGIKHLNRLENVLARMEWDDASIAEGVLQDEHGNVVSGTMSNLILVKDGILIFPDLSVCGVNGVTRQRIMHWANGQQLAVKVQAVSMTLLMDADEIMLCNSVIGIWQVIEFQERIWPTGSVIQAIRHALHD